MYPNAPFRSRTESSLTVHALPSTDYHGFGHGLSDARPHPQRHSQSLRPSMSPAPEPSPLASPEPHLLLHARMYAAGHKFGIGGLQALALDKFKIQLTRHWCVVFFVFNWMILLL